MARYVRSPELRKKLRISQMTEWRWRKSGDLPHRERNTKGRVIGYLSSRLRKMGYSVFED